MFLLTLLPSLIKVGQLIDKKIISTNNWITQRFEDSCEVIYSSELS